MRIAVGHRARYEILYRLVHSGDMRSKELQETIDIDDRTLHYHLNKIVDVGLVENVSYRTRTGWLVQYYRATVFGEVMLTSGVDGLNRGEEEFEDVRLFG